MIRLWLDKKVSRWTWKAFSSLLKRHLHVRFFKHVLNVLHIGFSLKGARVSVIYNVLRADPDLGIVSALQFPLPQLFISIIVVLNSYPTYRMRRDSFSSPSSKTQNYQHSLMTV